MSLIGKGPAPAPGQASNNCSYPSPSTALVDTTRIAIAINVSSTAPTHVDARIRDRYVRYVNDPDSGIWRTYGDQPRERISPLALQLITVGRHEIGVELTHPQTGNVWSFEGDPDTVATLLWRAGQRYGCQAERKTVYWALREFCNLARRQAAARGAC